MVRLKVSLAAALLSACAAPKPPPQWVREQSILAAVVKEWDTKVTPECYNWVRQLQIVLTASGEAIKKGCNTDAYPGNDAYPYYTAGCFAWTKIYVYAESKYLEDTIAHEYVHALAYCEGRPMGHADPKLWGKDGVLDRATGNGGYEIPHATEPR